MLLPSGRSNSDVYPQQNSNKHSFTTSTSSPILYDRLNEPENGHSKNKNATQLETQEEKIQQPLTKPSELGLGQMVPNGNKSCAGVNESISYSIEKSIPAHFMLNTNQVENIEEIERQLNVIQNKLEEGWTVHVRKDGRLYYCNHLTRSSSWLPSIEDWLKSEDLPYGWERAIDSKGRSYYINHQNKTTTYEAPEKIKHDENPPQPRVIVLERSPNLGFGFVAGSEKPVLVRFITEGGPSINKLLPGDQILAVNGEDVKEAPRDHVIQLIRACEKQVTLLVCQPMLTCFSGRKSTLLSAGKRAKLRTRPNRVRFAESVCVNGAPLFPPSAFSLGDICIPPMANVLKVFLENGQTKSFKYDATTTVQDVMSSLLDKLCLKTPEIFSLVLEHVKSLKRNKFSLLDPEESLARIAARPGAHKLRCLFRVTFVPVSAADLAQKDLNALDYLYMQCCNDVTQERFSPELQPEIALRLATLQMYQHALANSSGNTKLSVKLIEREFGLERFLPPSLLDGMKRKELRRLLTHFYLEITSSSQKNLSQTQAKLNYLDIISTLPSYGAKCFSTNQRIGVERVILVGPRFGLSQITNARNSVPQAISAIEDISHIVINHEDDINFSIGIFMKRDRVVKFSMEDRDANELSLVLAGYFRLLTGNVLTVMRERTHDIYDEDNAPPFLAQHTVLPAYWSYLESYHDRAHSVNFFTPPPYHFIGLEKSLEKSPHNKNERYFYCSSLNNTISKSENSTIVSSTAMDLDIHSVMATELLEEAKDSGLSDSSGGGSNYCDQQEKAKMNNKDIEVLRRVQEMQKMVENSEQYLNEQGEIVNDPHEALSNCENKNYGHNGLQIPTNKMNTSAWNDLDSDCESLNSSKVSFHEDISQHGALNHSDSLVLLAEIINKDLSGISHGLNSINENSAVGNTNVYSPRYDTKDRTLSQLLNNIQLNLDQSQSESDAESILSPMNSPTLQRSTLVKSNVDRLKENQKSVFRGSFGLHSPDDDYFCSDAKDSNLKQYLRKLGEACNSEQTPICSETKQKLSELYSEALVENDSDLIDLRAIPPPQTPDDLDAFSLLNAPPKGFDDGSMKTMSATGKDLDDFLEKVVVAPPTQKITPSKELTPEEIMSFIIPPPPNLDLDVVKSENPNNNGDVTSNDVIESFYSNSSSINENSLNSTFYPKQKEDNVIEYATVERKGAFSCCPKTKKTEIHNEHDGKIQTESEDILQVPPRQQSKDKLPPARPPKSADLIKRYSPKKNYTLPNTFQFPSKGDMHFQNLNDQPPSLPPRISPTKYNPLPMNTEIPTARLRSNGPFPLPSNSQGLSLPLSAMKRDNISNSSIHFSPQASQKNFVPQVPPRESLKCMPPRSLTFDSDAESPSLQHSLTSSNHQYKPVTNRTFGDKIIIKNGHVIDAEALLAKTDIAMTGLLVKLDQIAAQCAAAQSAGGGASIDEDKFQRARNELTEQTLSLVTASKFLVISMSETTLATLPDHLTSCLTALRRITELTQDMTRHTSAPLQTRNIVLKVHDVASSFRELVQVEMGPLGAGQLALQAECLANVLATLLRSLRVFSP